MNISKTIDHTLLSADTDNSAIARHCEEAVKYDFYSVCVQPAFVKQAKGLLEGSEIKTGTVVGFPMGATHAQVKIYEAIESMLYGADELDIVLNIGKVKSGEWLSAARELEGILAATPGSVHKIIVETCYLTEDEKKRACDLVLRSGAEFIKTSTGFGPAGAALKDVELFRSLAGEKLGIKAAGGIRTLKQVKEFLDAGATRIGTSSGVAIIHEQNA